MNKLSFLFTACLTCLSIQPVLGANYGIDAKVLRAFLPGFITVSPLPNTAMNLNSPHIIEVEFTLHASGFDAGANQRGFHNMVFNIGLTGDSLAPVQAYPEFPDWFPNNPAVDTNGATAGGSANRWYSNENIGSSSAMQILLDLDTVTPNKILNPPHPQDPRPHVGESPGTPIGKVWLYWDGIGPESLSVSLDVKDGVPQVSYSKITDGLPVNDEAAVFTGTTLNFGVAPGTGDFDGDGDVDGADFVAWQTNFPTTSGATPANGDTDYDGDVDSADFAIWQTNFQSAQNPGASPVPEPAGWIALAIGGLIALRKFK